MRLVTRAMNATVRRRRAARCRRQLAIAPPARPACGPLVRSCTYELPIPVHMHMPRCYPPIPLPFTPSKTRFALARDATCTCERRFCFCRQYECGRREAESESDTVRCIPERHSCDNVKDCPLCCPSASLNLTVLYCTLVQWLF